MLGSAFTEKEDEYSDVDPVFVIKAECYEQFDKELPGFYERECDEIVLWWPERFNTPTFRNYAVIFRHESVLMQYDITIEKEPQKGSQCIMLGQSIFDKTGYLLKLSPQISLVESSPDEIMRAIDTYWVWLYIQAKYLRRKDIVKLIYVQQELFHAHIKLIACLQDNLRKFNWWCDILNAIKDSDCRDILLSYMSWQGMESTSSNIKKQIAAFVRDAQSCCQIFGLPFPSNKEQKICGHIQQSLSAVEEN